MNFFRLRVINTLLFFLVGIVLGFILKERFYPAARAPAQSDYQASYSGRAEALPAARPEAEEPADEPYPVQEAENDAAGPLPAADPPRPSVPREDPAQDKAEALVIEPAATPGESRGAKRPAAKGEESAFFKSPAAYLGRELELELQMITAKKSPPGWRVNLVYSGPDRKIDYLYVEDSELLGEKPDLRIGYVYKVRFLCGKGETASGNTLLAIAAAGGKAAWATGLSAVE
ncbi:MAG: hypothetical protein Q7R35_13515 [Elusimicrobiota bacterium]|nr:hypothetical protein [Elusimicrobiota bacterium]